MLTQQRDLVNEHNQTLSMLDNQANIINDNTKKVNEFSERWLKAVGVKYGFDSSEYEMAGGTRKSERKKPGKKGGGTIPTP